MGTVPATVDPKYSLMGTPEIATSILHLCRELDFLEVWHAGTGSQETHSCVIISMYLHWAISGFLVNI